MKLISTDFLLFKFFCFKNALISYNYLSWPVLVCFWSIEKENLLEFNLRSNETGLKCLNWPIHARADAAPKAHFQTRADTAPAMANQILDMPIAVTNCHNVLQACWFQSTG